MSTRISFQILAQIKCHLLDYLGSLRCPADSPSFSRSFFFCRTFSYETVVALSPAPTSVHTTWLCHIRIVLENVHIILLQGSCQGQFSLEAFPNIFHILNCCCWNTGEVLGKWESVSLSASNSKELKGSTPAVYLKGLVKGEKALGMYKQIQVRDG